MVYNNAKSSYRTKTYIAADWSNDIDAVEQIYRWKNSNYWSLDFVDAHDLTQARDSSLNCSIKASLKKRLDVSKTFILIVGNQTKLLRSGSCQYCNSYNSRACYCARGHSVDYRSYIEYECEEAIESRIRIVVLYHSTYVDKEKCPHIMRHAGVHLPMKYIENGKVYWNYGEIKNAISI